MRTIDRFLGTYEGAAIWHEANGVSGSYAVRHQIEATDNGFIFRFRHVFDDGTADVDAIYTMAWTTETLFVVRAGDVLIGKGYVFDDFCHHTMELGEKIIEASCIRTEQGMRVCGSSSRNAAGNAIAWQEVLRRTDISAR